ncbi:MAG: glycosyltransferase [Chitinophagales bacterium]|nr:glycosyltransferase [Chitinophagales bacterium]MDW8418451.1 glycosyltransferase [Chitinophagales bacterium]
MNLSPLLLISVAFSAVYLVMVMYFLAGWLRAKKTTGNLQGDLPFVSIIIPTRNESENIQNCLRSIFAQNYPRDKYEVIVVDDYSTDATLRLAREMQQPNLLVLDLMQYLGRPGEYIPNKKKAIALGIKNAKGPIIITTDGDCTRGTNWLRTMVGAYLQGNYKLLTGPVMMKPARWPLEIFQQLDVINLVAITGATITNGFPTMCNGANLLYPKEVFAEVEGFKGNMELPTGDDIFLMQKIAARYPEGIGFVKNMDACVFTRPEKTLSAFISQRVRWISKSSRYGASAVATVLYFAYLFHLLIVIDGLYALSGLPAGWWPVAIAGGTKFTVDLLFNLPVVIFFRKPLLLLAYPIVNIFYVIYVVVIGVLSLTGKYRWKDRLIS